MISMKNIYLFLVATIATSMLASCAEEYVTYSDAEYVMTVRLVSSLLIRAVMLLRVSTIVY